VASQLRRRPWLVPAVLLGATAVVLVLRARRDDANLGSNVAGA
jgi:hypothetical protein